MDNMNLYPRHILPRVLEALDDSPVVLIHGPRQSGKTTLARIIANETNSEFVQISAVLAGVGDIREIVTRAKKHRHPVRQLADSGSISN